MPLPNAAMSFSPFAILTAEEMNDLVENDQALADGTGLNTGAISTTALADTSVTATKLSTDAIYLSDNAQSTSQGSLSTSETAITNMSITFTVPSTSRKVMIMAKGQISNTNTQTTTIRLRQTNLAGTIVDTDSIFIAAATASESYTSWAVLTLTPGSYTYLVTTQQASGTGTATNGKILGMLV